MKCQAPSFHTKTLLNTTPCSWLIALLYGILAPSIIICETNSTAMILNHRSSSKAHFLLTIYTSHSFLYSSIILLLEEIMLEQKLYMVVLSFWVSNTNQVTIFSRNGVLPQSSGCHAAHSNDQERRLPERQMCADLLN